MPNPFRWLLAQFISMARHKKAQGIYERMGGKSPLLENTVAQKLSLEKALSPNYKVFIAMRYWHPFTDDAVDAVKAYNPDQVVLLPLSPHFSTTTTGSSVQEWYRVAKSKAFSKPTRSICCFPLNESFIQAHVNSLWPVYEKAQAFGHVRVLFSAHSLPQKIIHGGDPYQWQTEQCAEKIIETLEKQHTVRLDWRVCYQSKVGPVPWLQPTLDSEIDKAAKDGVALVVVPISFVSDHSETLVELDMDFLEKAKSLGVPFYGRVPSLGTHDFLVKALCQLAENHQSPNRLCPKEFCGCFLKEK
jgi:ferrochelatase